MALTWRRAGVWTFFALILIGILYYLFRPEPVPVDLGTVTRGELHVTVDEEGRTRVKEVYVVSAPLAGRVMRIEIKVGDQVTAGHTLLATIQETDPAFLNIRAKREAEAAVKAAEAAQSLAKAELARARAELAFARAELERSRALARDHTISQSALERAELEFKTRQAAVGTAEASLRVREFEVETARAKLIGPAAEDSARKEASECCVNVFAPVSGSVLRILHESEGVVEAGAPLLELGDPQDLEIVVEMLSSDAVKIKEGAEVLIHRWGGPGTLRGRVRRIEPYGFTKVSALGIEEQRVNVLIDFTDPPEKWRSLGHGFRVETQVLLWRGEGILKIPVGALFHHEGEWAVFGVSEGRARLRRVKVGRRNNTEAQILEGLKEGEKVILHPSDRISDGVQVLSRQTG